MVGGSGDESKFNMHLFVCMALTSTTHVELGLVTTTTNHNRPPGSKWTWNLYLGDMATYILCLGLFLFYFLARSHWQHTTHRPLSDAPHR